MDPQDRSSCRVPSPPALPPRREAFSVVGIEVDPQTRRAQFFLLPKKQTKECDETCETVTEMVVKPYKFTPKVTKNTPGLRAYMADVNFPGDLVDVVRAA